MKKVMMEMKDVLDNKPLNNRSNNKEFSDEEEKNE